MTKITDDKMTEYLRYEYRARAILTSGTPMDMTATDFGSSFSPPTLRAPYLRYEECITKFIKAHNKVLELGSGTGLHTYALTQTEAQVVASDISPHSLEVLSKRFGDKVRTEVADMEHLPFKDDSFDVVTSAGSLSYGEPDLVDAEIKRVLRRGGTFICVDSLNHNPIYRMNRWLHYLAGSRTRSTLERIPTVERMERFCKGFGYSMVWYFGAVSYLSPLLASMLGQARTSRMSDTVDRLMKVRKSAFKFVLVALRHS